MVTPTSNTTKDMTTPDVPGNGCGGASGSGGGGDLDKRFIWGKRYIDDLIAREHDPDGDDTFTRHYALSDRQWNIVALAEDDGTIVERYRYTPYGRRTVMDKDFAVQTTGTAHDFWRGFQGLPHDEESGLVENRMRVLDVLLGRFVQVDPLGYPDGMNRYAAYHVMWGGVDPDGLRSRFWICFVACMIGANQQDVQTFFDQKDVDAKILREEQIKAERQVRREANKKGEKLTRRQVTARAKDRAQSAANKRIAKMGGSMARKKVAKMIAGKIAVKIGAKFIPGVNIISTLWDAGGACRCAWKCR